MSVVTLGELELGVLAATDEDVLARRADTLALARQSDPIPPVSEPVMTASARLVIDCRRMGPAHSHLTYDELTQINGARRLVLDSGPQPSSLPG